MQSSPDTALPTRSSLGRRLLLARAALLWERIWPSLWPAAGVVGTFLVLALFDVPARLPSAVQALLLAVTGVGLAAALYLGLQRFRLPDRDAARRRIETASGLAHRPLATLEDRLAGGADDPAAQALWQAHRARMAAAAKRLRVGAPAAGLLRRDPYALRALLGLLLLLGAVDAGGDWSDRIVRSLIPSFGPGAAAVPVALDIWVSPPEYTGLPPQFLTPGAAAPAVAVPTGSTVLAQVHGGNAVPQLLLDEHASEFARIDDTNFKGGATITAGKRLAVMQDGKALGAWPIKVIPDLAPTVAFAKPPSHTDRGVLRLEYKASDDYGVESVKAQIRRKGDPTGEVLSFDLPLPGLHLKDAAAASFHDLTPHPWAGLPVEIRLVATDAIGQTGESDPVETTLPERTFHHPIARAIIDARKDLTLHPDDRKPVAETLSDLSLRPGLFGNDIVVFMALRTAQARLMLDHDPGVIAALQRLLWDTALRVEDGRTTTSQRDLRQAMRALQDALARNAPDSEIDRLIRELQQAIDRHLQAMAQQMQREQVEPRDMQPIDPSRVLTRQDLQRMLDRMRDLAHTGAKDRARELLSQLQEMLENLRMARPGQMMPGQNQSMRQMQDMMQRQQQLLDRSFRRSRQPGQNGDEAQDDANQQEMLRRMLGDMMRQMGDQNGDIPAPMGRAERAMRNAVEALRRAQSGQAIGPQTEALDALQQAARAMANQMLGRNGMPDGGDPGDHEGLDQAERDPFGRLPRDNGNGGIDDGGEMRMGKSQSDYGLEKAKEILRELRERAGERTRPELERDYIDRLLKQF